MSEPIVSIIIPAHNEGKILAETLEAICRQDYPKEKLEIIVVDDCSTDETPHIVEKYPVRYIRNSQNLGLAASLNIGFHSSKGEVVMTLHADCIPLSPDWVKTLIAHFDDPKVGAVSSHLIIDLDKLRELDRYFCYIYISGWHFLYGKPLPVPLEEDRFVNFVGDKCDAYRRSILEEIGGFDQSFKVANEDVDISEKIRRSGYRLVVDHKAKVRHALSSHQSNLTGHLKKALQYSSPQVLIASRYGYLVGSEHIFSFICLLYLFPIFLVLNNWATSSPILALSIEYLSLVLISVFLLTRRMPSYYEGEVFDKKRVFRKMLSFLSLTLLMIIFIGFTTHMPPILNFLCLPVYIGLSILFDRSAARGLSYFKTHKSLSGAVSVAFLSLVWHLLYGIGFFKGITMYLLGKKRF